MNNNYTPTGVEQTLKWGDHQRMLEEHRQNKAKRREDHKRTHGKVRPYPGHLY